MAIVDIYSKNAGPLTRKIVSALDETSEWLSARQIAMRVGRTETKAIACALDRLARIGEVQRCYSTSVVKNPRQLLRQRYRRIRCPRCGKPRHRKSALADGGRGDG